MNKVIRNLLHCVLILLLSSSTVLAQPTSLSERADQVLNFPDKLFSEAGQASAKATKRLQQQSHKYLTRLKKKEQQLYSRMYKRDSIQAKAVFGNIDSVYNSFDPSAYSGSTFNSGKLPLHYSGKLDSMQTAIGFLQKAPNLPAGTAASYQKLTQHYSGIQDKLNQTDHIEKLLQERKQLLMSKFSNLGLSKQLQQYRKQVYYYQQELKTYKAALENPRLLEQKALAVLSKVPAFRQYFDKFSQLGGMFRLPGQTADMDPSQLLNGLQVRQSVMEELSRHMGGLANTQQAVSNGLQQGQAQLADLKSKLTSSLNNGEPVDMPGFKPNDQKHKSFLKRLQVGTNLQSQRSTAYFPTTSDLGLSLGYKMNQRSVLGAGLSYKVGWGQNIRAIRVTHEGVGLRSFLDWRIKGKFWASGGYEWNYRTRLENLNMFKAMDHWQQSALMGLQLKQSIGKNNSTVSILYDALWRRQVPQTQPLVFRVGYLLK